MVNYLETEHLSINELEHYVHEDVWGVIDVLGNGETAWWFDVRPVEYYDDASDFLKYNDADSYGIIDKESGEMVGILQIKNPGIKDTVELGYALSVESRGKGFMTEAVKAVCADLFEKPYASKIRLMILPDNEASIGVATRCGFKRVERGPDERERRALDGEFVDEYVLEKGPTP